MEFSIIKKFSSFFLFSMLILGVWLRISYAQDNPAAAREEGEGHPADRDMTTEKGDTRGESVGEGLLEALKEEYVRSDVFMRISVAHTCDQNGISINRVLPVYSVEDTEKFLTGLRQKLETLPSSNNDLLNDPLLNKALAETEIQEVIGLYWHSERPEEKEFLCRLLAYNYSDELHRFIEELLQAKQPVTDVQNAVLILNAGRPLKLVKAVIRALETHSDLDNETREALVHWLGIWQKDAEAQRFLLQTICESENRAEWRTAMRELKGLTEETRTAFLDHLIQGEPGFVEKHVAMASRLAAFARTPRDITSLCALLRNNNLQEEVRHAIIDGLADESQSVLRRTKVARLLHDELQQAKTAMVEDDALIAKIDGLVIRLGAEMQSNGSAIVKVEKTMRGQQATLAQIEKRLRHDDLNDEERLALVKMAVALRERLRANQELSTSAASQAYMDMVDLDRQRRRERALKESVAEETIEEATSRPARKFRKIHMSSLAIGGAPVILLGFPTIFFMGFLWRRKRKISRLFAVILVVPLVLTGYLSVTMVSSAEAACRENLTSASRRSMGRIGKMLFRYAEENGGVFLIQSNWPEALIVNDEDKNAFYLPEPFGGGDIESWPELDVSYHPFPLAVTLGSKQIIVWQKTATQGYPDVGFELEGRFVVLADGNVNWLNENKFRERLRESIITSGKSFGDTHNRLQVKDDPVLCKNSSEEVEGEEKSDELTGLE